MALYRGLLYDHPLKINTDVVLYVASVVFLLLALAFFTISLALPFDPRPPILIRQATLPLPNYCENPHKSTRAIGRVIEGE